jgi:sugar O-acyltransferase (sialic acid O-acetyltransferase NeuD family)
MQEIIIYGSGGHGRVVADAVKKAGYIISGWLDDTKSGGSVYEYPILGGRKDVRVLIERGIRFAVVAIGDNTSRRCIADDLLNAGFRFATIVHPSAIVGRGVEIGEGAVVLARAVINADAVVGRHAIINTGAIVEHNCRIGDFAHIASGVSMGGRVVVGDESLVGTGASIRFDVKIGKGCIIGVGAVVVADVPDGMVVVGNPARPII